MKTKYRAEIQNNDGGADRVTRYKSEMFLSKVFWRGLRDCKRIGKNAGKTLRQEADYEIKRINQRAGYGAFWLKGRMEPPSKMRKTLFKSSTPTLALLLRRSRAIWQQRSELYPVPYP